MIDPYGVCASGTPVVKATFRADVGIRPYGEARRYPAALVVFDTAVRGVGDAAPYEGECLRIP